MLEKIKQGSKTLIFTLFLFILSLSLVSCANVSTKQVINTPTLEESQEIELNYDEAYYELSDVAKYIYEFQALPPNYITKQEAKDLDWSVEDNQGLVIGGDRFYNREGLLPESPGRKYYEADLISSYSYHRGPERLVYSNDGLIFYTEDHYDSFKRLYWKR